MLSANTFSNSFSVSTSNAVTLPELKTVRTLSGLDVRQVDRALAALSRSQSLRVELMMASCTVGASLNRVLKLLDLK